MTTDLDVRCECGKLRGIARDLAPAYVNRAVCYCDDCQSFAHFLGRADDVLDEHGGSEIYQLAPVRFRITAGQEQLACVRLRPKGLYRWYAACCKTPLANSLTSAIPFVGLIRPCVKGADETSVGPVKMRIHGRFARGGAAPSAHPKAPLSAAFSILFKLLRRRFRGQHRQHPLFNAETGKAVVKPQVLEPSELATVEKARDEWLRYSA
ncbi:MAG: DUF6151 family protein [Pseudomonadota bacterium]